jgi:hypothetical protein
MDGTNTPKQKDVTFGTITVSLVYPAANARNRTQVTSGGVLSCGKTRLATYIQTRKGLIL